MKLRAKFSQSTYSFLWLSGSSVPIREVVPGRYAAGGYAQSGTAGATAGPAVEERQPRGFDGADGGHRGLHVRDYHRRGQGDSAARDRGAV